jgi:hypothetical protein
MICLLVYETHKYMDTIKHLRLAGKTDVGMPQQRVRPQATIL